MVIMTYVVIAFLVVISFISTRKLRLIPRPLQNMVEVIFDFIEDVTVGTLGNKDGKVCSAYFSIFVFVLAANWIGIWPHITTFIGFLIALVHQLFTGAAGEWAVNAS